MGGDKKTKKKGRRGSSTSPATRSRCSLQFLASENSSDEVQLNAVEQLKMEPTNFPIGCRILVKGQHPNHGGKVGTAQGHTTFFIRVLFETSKKTILISPRFLLQVKEDNDSYSVDTNELTETSTLTPRRSLLKTPCHSSISSRRVSITPSRSTVKFNMERNCFASYVKGDPPNVVTTEDSIISNSSSNASNIVEHLPEEVDDVTLRNEKVLAEWDDFTDNDDEEEDSFFLYCQ